MIRHLFAIVALLLVGFASSAAAEDPELTTTRWYLGTEPNHLLDAPPGGSFILPAHDEVAWTAGAPALADVSFGIWYYMSWLVSLDTTCDEMDGWDGDFRAEVGYLHPETGAFHLLDFLDHVVCYEGSLTMRDIPVACSYPCDDICGYCDDEVVLPAGGTLALKLRGSDAERTVVLGEGSSLQVSQWPASEPVPELPALALVLAGASVVGGALWLRRR